MHHLSPSLFLSVAGLIGLTSCGDSPSASGDITTANSAAAAATRAGDSTAAASESGSPTPDYVDSATCAECHPSQFQDWRGSHHDLAMQHANADSVLGDFDDASFESLGLTTRFFRKDGGFWVNTEGPDGALHDYPIAYTFGVEPLQQYLVEFSGGRLQCLTVAWDTDDSRWFTLYPDDRFPPDDALHWTGRYQNWNMMCADCHSTHLAKNYDAKSDTYDTTWKELNVTCQACHGPGAEHIALARENGEGWAPKPDESGLVIALQKFDAATQMEACAPCHSRRRPLTESAYIPGHFNDDYAIETLRSPLYFDDGQALEEVYVMGSFMQSKMHEKGVGCADCHNPHSLELWLPGDRVCTQCHSVDAPTDRFETLTKKDYATAEHHHHPLDSDGARCRNCHMPERTYMQIDERYDHSLRIPRPDVSAVIGTPNACNTCHDDQTPVWAADQIKEWTGVDLPPHRGVIFALAQSGNREVASPLTSIALDPGEPAIVRAAALDRLGAYQFADQVKVMALGDGHALVRAAGLEQLGEQTPEVVAEKIVPLLSDPVRRVRIAAARALAGAAGAALEARSDPAYAAAKAEMLEAFAANADTPSSSLNLAVYLVACEDTKGAVAAYRRALELDAEFLPAVFNLATLLTSLGRAPEAKELLTNEIVRHPDEGELRYSLGLLLAEMNDMEGAVDALGAAAERLPGRPRVHYNYGLAANQIGRTAEGEMGLLRAAAIDPRNPEFAYALSTFYLEDSRFDTALDWARRLVQLVPEAPGPKQLITEIERQREAAR